MTATPTRPAELRASSLEELAETLDATEGRLAELDPLPRQVVTDALAARDELHRRALVSMVRALRDDPRGKELLFALVDEPEVHLVLSVHGIIRPDPVTLAGQALDRVRPDLRSHGGDVSLVEVADGVARVRLEGACNGCSMSAVTLRGTVESALLAGVPGLLAVEVVPAEPEPVLVPLSSIGRRPTDAPPEGTGWFRTVPVDKVPAGSLEALSLQPAEGPAVEVVVVHAAGKLTAYLNACAHQGLPLDNALVDASEGTLTCPWHGLCYDTTDGNCLTMPGAQLQPLPLVVAEGHVWVRAGGDG